jgi:hypothetical protein
LVGLGILLREIKRSVETESDWEPESASENEQKYWAMVKLAPHTHHQLDAVNNLVENYAVHLRGALQKSEEPANDVSI